MCEDRISTHISSDVLFLLAHIYDISAGMLQPFRRLFLFLFSFHDHILLVMHIHTLCSFFLSAGAMKPLPLSCSVIVSICVYVSPPSG